MLNNFLFSLFLIFVSVKGSILGANETDPSKCKVHYTISEGSYKQFFELSPSTHPNGSVLDFHFGVLAISDAHILLAPSDQVNKDDPVYEIVLGAGGNTFSDIRRKQKSAVLASSREKNILSALDARFFWIHISKEGIIQVGREGQEIAFLNYQDSDLLPLKYFSFCTWPGVEAKWFYDCVRTNSDANNTSGENESKAVVRPMTDLERLRKDLLFYYDPYVKPVYDENDPLDVYAGLRIINLRLDERKSLMSLSGKMQLSWIDEKLRWNSSDYGGISEIHIFHREIWLPDLVLLNAAGTGTDIFQSTMLSVNEDGFVQWRPVVNLDVWCDASKLGSWPTDEHTCDIILGFWSHMYNTHMYFNGSGILHKRKNPEWKVLSITALSADMQNTVWINYFKSISPYNISSTHPALQLSFQLKRNGYGFYTLLFSPFLIISVMMLSVFWVSPLSYHKITLGCLQLIITCMILAAIGIIMPGHPKTVPFIVILYDVCLVLGLFSVICSTVIINISRTDHPYGLPHCLHVLLTMDLIKKVLFLPDVKSSNYGKLESINHSEKQQNIQDMWLLLGVTLDRVLFCLYLLFFIFSLTF